MVLVELAQSDLVAFTLYPTLCSCCKDDLLVIMDFFNLLVPAEASKWAIKQVLQDELIWQGVLPEMGESPSVASSPLRVSTVAEASVIWEWESAWILVILAQPGRNCFSLFGLGNWT